MTGGSGGESSMKSTERLNPKSLQWTSGSQLPESLYGHCVVSINDTTILIIGGGKIVEGSDKTFFFHNDGTYTVRSILILGVQVILFEIDGAIFYTNLHQLFCQFIS